MEKKIDEKPIERIKDKPFLTITETAIYLGVTRPTVYGYIKRGELKVTRLGFKYLLKKEDIDELFNNPTEFHTPTKEKTPITDFYTTAEVKEKYHVNESWIFLVARKTTFPGLSIVARPTGARSTWMLTSLRKPRIPTLQNGIAHKKYRKNSA